MRRRISSELFRALREITFVTTEASCSYGSQHCIEANCYSALTLSRSFCPVTTFWRLQPHYASSTSSQRRHPNKAALITRELSRVAARCVQVGSSLGGQRYSLEADPYRVRSAVPTTQSGALLRCPEITIAGDLRPDQQKRHTNRGVNNGSSHANNWRITLLFHLFVSFRSSAASSTEDARTRYRRLRRTELSRTNQIYKDAPDDKL